MVSSPSEPAHPDVLDRLKNVFERLGCPSDRIEKSVSKLAESATARSYSSGDYLFRESSKNTDLLIIHSGKVALEMSIPGRGRARILTLGEGDIVAWSALLSSGVMTTSAIAMEPTEIIALPAQRLLELSDTDYEFGYRLMKAVALAIGNRLVATRLQLLDLFASPNSPSGFPRTEI